MSGGYHTWSKFNAHRWSNLNERRQAEAHFRKISDESFIAFPSGRNKILWDFSDPEQLMLVIRVACPSHLRLKVEQAVFRDTWRILRPGQLTKPHCDISAQ